MQIILYGISFWFTAYESEPTYIRECKSLSTDLFPFKQMTKSSGRVDCISKW